MRNTTGNLPRLGLPLLQISPSGAGSSLSMGSYYREHVSYPNVTAGPYPPDLAATLESVGSNITNTHQDDPKYCSVKGCSASLPSGYPHKMCEECRGRHRVYAMTKRAKRKMEKALLNGSAQHGQPVAWMPPDETGQQAQDQSGQSSEAAASPSRQYEVPVQGQNHEGYDFSQQWDASSIDPRLFSHTHTASELAGALTLPPSHHPVNNEQYSRHNQPPQQRPHQRSVTSPPSSPSPSDAPEIHPVLAEVLKSVPGLSFTTRVTSGPTISSGSAEGPLPPRFCSIKGCKTLIAGNSFFKMCEPCRDRYRNYGTTKRAKWKREKEVAVAELNKLRAEEDVRRAAEGLPPLPPPDDVDWHDYHPGEDDAADPTLSTPGSSGAGEGGDSAAPAAVPPRMCTVSHCREILPGDYQFLRCERHRIQNRHHSKLKRVRDKEVKAQVYDGWAAAIAPRADSFDSVEDRSAEDDPAATATVDPDEVAAQEIALAFGELDRSHEGEGNPAPEFANVVPEAAPMVTIVQETGTGTQIVVEEPADDTPLGDSASGVPPAARGFRRTNHVCSIKQCANLLSPSNPWKMCDLCRSRDRAGRRLKALRDSGLIPAELAAGKIVEVKMEVERLEREKGPRKEKRPKAKKAKKGSESNADADARERDSAAPPEQLQQPGPGTSVAAIQQDGDSSTSVFSVPVQSHENLIFMEPLLGPLASNLEPHLAQASGSGTSNSGGNQALADCQAQGAATSATNVIVNGLSGSDALAAATLTTTKKQNKGKGRATAQTTEDSGETATVKSTNAAPTSTAETSHQGSPTYPYYPPPPNGQHPYPYYMPPYMPPYSVPAFHYGYPPPPSQSKAGAGAYSPPPAYQPPPYGAYPYSYPYASHPHPYPSQSYPPLPGQSYPPPPVVQPYPPPPAGHSYPLATSYPPHPSGDQSQSQQPYARHAPYPQPVPPYPYTHHYSVAAAPPQNQPPPSQPPRQQPEPQPRPTNPPTPAPEEPGPSGAAPSASTRRPQPPRTSTKDSSTSGAPNDNDNSIGSNESAQRQATFIVRTSETYGSTSTNTNGHKPIPVFKRQREEDYRDTSPSKRSELDAGGTYSRFQIVMANTSAPPTHRTPFPGEGMMDTSSLTPPPAYGYAPQPPLAASEQAVFTAPSIAQVATAAESQNPEKAQCSNKTCKRIVPSGSTGSLCERCRERLKKKQAKAKHRFKLEPKALLGRDSPLVATG
ncbi:hypothetical protein DICSQDRAFT_179027 [Dichomitus squalens LYAD-421 SS1]|uniref:uncharacterized protein n=1 Tax=Dichomitus squalens (strain LYAD-421) TaxID=732165 RepID=UPI0004415D22|nr:uncharacterized protein DICSQDRAFT_179027 [Dichomitus squalens LYAD-421 SS1]EJF63775.1 hypothetical protein DICSQDRAFT_179027 [Dichomitus squalens LYAD-421 SS1]